MDSASLRSLTPLLDGIDKWVELAPLLPVIVSLELVLSADNAVALASITKNLNNIDLGLIDRLVMRQLLNQWSHPEFASIRGFQNNLSRSIY